MKKEAKIQEFWKQFLIDTNRDDSVGFLDSFYFGRTEDIANELLSLVLNGTKKATTSCLPIYDIYNEKIAEIGDLSIITDWDGNPKCVIETTCVTIIPFKDVTFEICSREGEDDNLQSWQNTHSAIYEAEGKKEGYDFTWETPVVFEDFKVVYTSDKN